MKFFVAGVKFHQLSSVIDVIEEGNTLDITPEPTNQYDPNAVALRFKTVMIGYVPKKHSAEVSALSEVSNIQCKVLKLDKRAKPWEQLYVEISEVE